MTQPAYQVYLAGPMTNIPAFNFPLFFQATDWLRGVKGWQVLSPAEKDLEKIPWEEMQLVPGFDTGDVAAYVENSSFTMANAMEWDLPAILNSNGIALLPDWERSTGARWERTVAEALGRDIWLVRPGDPSQALKWDVIPDSQPDRLTQYLRGFGTPTSTAELLTDLRSRLNHVPGVSEHLQRIEAALA